MDNRVSSYFPKGGYSATQTELKDNMNTSKVKRHRNSDTKKQATENHNNTTALEWSVMNYWGGLKLVLRAQLHPQFLKWYNTFSWLFGSHDSPLIRQ